MILWRVSLYCVSITQKLMGVALVWGVKCPFNQYSTIILNHCLGTMCPKDQLSFWDRRLHTVVTKIYLQTWSKTKNTICCFSCINCPLPIQRPLKTSLLTKMNNCIPQLLPTVVAASTGAVATQCCLFRYIENSKVSSFWWTFGTNLAWYSRW